MAYATTEDLEARWRAMTPSETAKAEVLLEDASAIIDAEIRGRTVPGETLRMVACSIVKRAMGSADWTAGVAQASQTAGPYTVSLTPANPGGDLYLTGQERRALGSGRQRVGSWRAKVGGCDG